MIIGAANQGNNSFVPEVNAGSNEAAHLQRQKEMLQRQLETVKAKQTKNKEEKDTAEKQIEQLKKKIAEIDQQIQKLSQRQPQEQNASETAEVKTQKAAQAPASRQVGETVDKQKDDEKKKKEINAPFDATGEWIDRYA